MASFDAPVYTEELRSRDRAKAIAEAGLDHSVPHEYTVPAITILTGGARMVVFDADGLAIGFSPDLLAEGVFPDPNSVSWGLAHQPEPEQESSLSPVPLTEREQFELQRDLEEWRNQFIDPKARARVKQALHKRRLRGPKNPDEKRGRPRKYTEFGALLKYTVPKEKRDAAQPELRPASPTARDGQAESRGADALDNPSPTVELHERRADNGGPTDPSQPRRSALRRAGRVGHSHRDSG